MIASYLFGKILDYFPNRVARLIIRPQKIQSKIEIDLRRINPIDICFGKAIH